MEINQEKTMIDWKKYFDHIYCVHFVEYKERRLELMEELNRVGILDSGIFSFKYTFRTPLDNVLLNSYNFSRASDAEKFDVPKLNLAMGHYACIKEALGLEYKRILLLEDDIAFLKDLGEIERILEESPHYDIELYDKCGDEEIWQFFLKNRPINDDYCGYSLLWCTSCYSLNKRGMEHIVKCQETKFNVADFYTNEFAPYNDFNGNRQLIYDGVRRAVSIKNIACQKPSKGDTVTEHGDSKWVYKQKGLSFCGLEPDLYNL